MSMIEKECKTLKSDIVKDKILERVKLIFESIDKDTVSIPYRYPTISNTNSIYDNIIGIDKILEYFDKVYSIYPRKVSKVQAKESFEHKLRGLEKEEARKKAGAIYRMLETQNNIWQSENNGEGRKIEHIPHFSTWLNANVEDSPNYRKGRK